MFYFIIQMGVFICESWINLVIRVIFIYCNLKYEKFLSRSLMWYFHLEQIGQSNLKLNLHIEIFRLPFNNIVIFFIFFNFSTFQHFFPNILFASFNGVVVGSTIFDNRQIRQFFLKFSLSIFFFNLDLKWAQSSYYAYKIANNL